MARVDESAEYQCYIAALVLLGMGLVFGNNTEVAEYYANDALQGLLDVPLRNITDAYNAWAEETADACGLPQAFQPGSPTDDNDGAWLVAAGQGLNDGSCALHAWAGARG